MRNVTSQSAFAFGIWSVVVLLHVALGRDVLGAQTAAGANPPLNGSGGVYRYRPKTRVPPTLESIFNQLAPGNDEFPEEKEAEELAARLRELSARVREHPNRAGDAADWLLAPAFKGSRLLPPD